MTNSTCGVEIAGLGHYAPTRVITSAAIETDLGLEQGWIERRTGIRERRYAADDEALTDLAAKAGEAALQKADIDRRDISLVLLATSTPDHLLPPSAPLLAHNLGLTNAGGIDLAGACAGFLYALVLADAYVRARREPVLLVAGNILSRRINPADRGSAVLFADAAGAVVLVPSERTDAGIRGVKLAASGADYGLIHIPAGGSRRPFAADVSVVDTRMVLSDGQAVYTRAVDMMATSATTALERAGISVGDIAHFAPHQANARMTATLCDRLGVPTDKLLTTIAEYGNSSAGTIPLTLSVHANERRYSPGDNLLLTAAGAGLVGGAVVWRW